MSIRRGPTLRAQWLGKRIRELRESANLTLKEVGDYLQRDPTTLSRMEAGVIPPRASDVLAMLNLFSIDDQTLRAGLERLSRDVRHKGWWDGYDADWLGGMIDHAWIEARAEKIHSYNAMTIPGLLQTREYAETVIKTADPEASPQKIEHWVEFRMSRQRILTHDRPSHMTAILDEAALRRAVGGPSVMAAQLRALVDLAEHPAVIIRVLPFSAGAHSSLAGPFTIFDLPDPYPEVACVDSLGGAIYVEAPKVKTFLQAYNHLREVALPAKESAALISVMAEKIEGTSQRSSRDDQS